MNRDFLDLSAALTGFSTVDLLGTGVAEQYLSTARQQSGPEKVDRLLTVWREIRDSEESLETALREKILSMPDLGPLARRIIKMWYLAQWEGNSFEDTFIVSAEAYQQGLVWDAIGAHPQGAKHPGFGSWSLLPKDLTEEKKS